MKIIPINLDKHRYDVYIGRGLMKAITRFVNSKTPGKVFILIDKKFSELNKNKFMEDLTAGISADTVIKRFSASEKNKNYESIINIHSFMQKHKLGRDSLMIAVGGGITGDVGGFAASTYMRGIPYVQIPTTMLAAVDSSVGGKTGINFNGAKNIVGAFYQPSAVFIDTDFFKTLPDEEIICGIGEILKYGYLTEVKFYKYLIRNIEKLTAMNDRAVARVVEESIVFKAGVVEADEKEKSLRKILNLGHTFAHAFEADRRHRIKHGQAVIVGLVCAVHLSGAMGLLDEKKQMEFIHPLIKFAEIIRMKKTDPQNVYKLMFSDKKNRGGKIKFVLIRDVGDIAIDVECPKDKIINSIEFALKYFGE